MRLQAGDVCFLVAGCFLRALIFNFGNLNAYYFAYIYGHEKINNPSIIDCALYISRGWTGPADVCTPDLSPVVVAGIGRLHESLGDKGLFVVSAIMQLLAAISLVQSYYQNKSLFWIIYWLNPVVIIQGAVSLIDSLRHLMFAILLASAVSEDKIIFGSVLAILISMNYQYACIIPIFLMVILSHRMKSSLLSSAVIAAVLALKTPNRVSSGIISSTSFTPSFSFLWYADAQMFKQFRVYFIQLWFAQPFLYSYPIALRLKESPRLAVIMCP